MTDIFCAKGEIDENFPLMFLFLHRNYVFTITCAGTLSVTRSLWLESFPSVHQGLPSPGVCTAKLFPKLRRDQNLEEGNSEKEPNHMDVFAARVTCLTECDWQYKLVLSVGSFGDPCWRENSGL